MSQTVACSKCGKKYKVADEKAGKKIKCTGCGTVIAIPAPSAAPGEEVDLWDLPPAEDSSGLPPAAGLPLRSKSGSKKSARAANSGRPTAMKVVLIVLSIIGGATILGCGGCLLATKLFFNKIGDAVGEMVEKDYQRAMDGQPASTNTDADGKPIPFFDLTLAKDTTSVSTFLIHEKEKVVEVRGVVRLVRGPLGKQGLCLGKAEGSFDEREMYQLKDQSSPFTKVFPNHIVTLRGKSLGWFSENVTMSDGEILKIEGKPCPQVTAESLAQDHDSMSQQEFSAKHAYEVCVFSGTVTEAWEAAERTPYCYVAPSPKLRIQVTFHFNQTGDEDKNLDDNAVNPERIKKGSRIKVVGDFQSPSAGSGILTGQRVLSID